MRINKFIASSSEYSRRKADELIMEGKVFLNGEKVDSPGVNINPEKDEIKILGKVLSSGKKKIYIALNKPKGYITTRSDELNRKTVMDLIPKNLNLKPVGRLDKDSEGLLLLSNDGEFINKLTHPKYECEKEYTVQLPKEFQEKDKLKLEKGIRIEGRKTYPAKILVLKLEKNLTLLRITIHEGRNRQIRKMFAQLGYPVKYLKRIRICELKIDNLEKGEFKYLTEKDLKCLLAYSAPTSRQASNPN